MRREALRACSTPLEAALFKVCIAAWIASFAFCGSLVAIASRAFFTALRTWVRTAAFRFWRFCAWRFLFSADFVFAMKGGYLLDGIPPVKARADIARTANRR